MNLLKLSWKNLTYKPLNLFLSTLLFALGIGIISLLFIVQKQIQENFENNLAGIDLVIGAKGSPLQMILCSMYHIDAPTGNITLQDARPFLNPNHPLIETAVPLSMGDSYRAYRILGTEHQFVDLYEGQIGEGRLWQNDYEITIGAEVSKKADLKIGDHFHSAHGLMDDEDMAHTEAGEFKVVGILQRSGTVLDQLILCNNPTYWYVHEHREETGDEGVNEEHGHTPDHNHKAYQEETIQQGDERSYLLSQDDDREITSILVKFKGRSYQALNLQRNINQNTDLQATTPAIEINRVFSLMGAAEKGLKVLAIAIMIVSALSIFVSLISSLKERKYELALMRVMGGSKSTLLTMILMEGLLLALIGYTFGILLSHGSMALFSKALEENYRYDFKAFSFVQEELFLLGAALGIGILAAILPALRASKTDISETLGST